MSELLFVGGGLGDERDLSRRTVEELRRVGAIFAEEYTAVFPSGVLERLAQEIGRPIRTLKRADVESAAPILERLGAGEDVAFLTPGDPFAATTHVALRLAAEEAGHHWRYAPAASVLTAAAGLLGVSHYRFGRTVTLPLPEPSFDPSSPWEWIGANRNAGLHTLVLLDLRPEEDRFLRAEAALEMLDRRDRATTSLPPDQPIGVVARVGQASARAWWGPIDRLRTVAFGPPMHAIIVPAPELHFQEAAAVKRWRIE
jgi:diphthine synthase